MEELRSRSAESFPSTLPPEASPLLAEATGREWERRAVQVGTVAGKAVAIFRRVRRQWDQFDPQQAAGDAAEALRRETAARSEEWRQAAKERGADLRRRAKAAYDQNRARAQQVGRDYPVQLVLVAAAAGFALGTGLRVWRSKRAA